MIRRALTNTGWLMGARGINAVLSLAYLALVTRSLGLAGFGQFILAVTFAQAVIGFTSFQTWQAVVRWGQDRERLPDATGFALALDAVTIAAGALMAGTILLLAGDWFPLPPELRLATFFFTMVCLVSIRSTPTGILRLHDRYAGAAIADSMTSIIRIIGAGLVAATQPGIVAYLLVWSLAEIGTAAAYWVLARRTQPLFWRHISLARIPVHAPDAWRFVTGTALSGTLLVASRQVLVLLVGALGGPALAGIYRVAAQVGEGLLKLAQALLRAVYPELVRDPASARALSGRITRIASVTGLVVVALAIVAGQWVIELIAGEQFLPAYVPMILLSAAAAVELAGATLEALLVARGRAMSNFLLRAVPTTLALLGLAWLVDAYGATGAAAAVLAASVCTVAGLFVANRQKSI